jgi:hypothetical protein
MPGVEVGTRRDRLLDLTKVETGCKAIGRKLASIDVFANPLNQGGIVIALGNKPRIFNAISSVEVLG